MNRIVNTKEKIVTSMSFLQQYHLNMVTIFNSNIDSIYLQKIAHFEIEKRFITKDISWRKS